MVKYLNLQVFEPFFDLKRFEVFDIILTDIKPE